MRSSGRHYFPIALPFLFVLFLFIILLIISIEIGLIGYAYEKMGINREYILTLLVLSLLGSYVNIPVAELPAKHVLPDQEVVFFGIRYVIPRIQERKKTTIAVNVGGAIIPTLLSLYLLVKSGIYIQSLIGVAIAAVIIHRIARPTSGVGIIVPIFIPPLIAASLALLLSRHSAPSLAYIVGSLGTLLGADLLNLNEIKGLGAPVASIGGAGTFDGIFMTGILAVLLA